MANSIEKLVTCYTKKAVISSAEIVLEGGPGNGLNNIDANINFGQSEEKILSSRKNL